MEREVGGGIGMGNTCKPMAVSFQCMTKFTTNKKQTNKQKTYTIEREKKNLAFPFSQPPKCKVSIIIIYI